MIAMTLPKTHTPCSPAQELPEVSPQLRDVMLAASAATLDTRCCGCVLWIQLQLPFFIAKEGLVYEFQLDNIFGWGRGQRVCLWGMRILLCLLKKCRLAVARKHHESPVCSDWTDMPDETVPGKLLLQLARNVARGVVA